MTASVPRLRPSIITATHVLAGGFVRSRTWQDAAALSNYLRGSGTVLVPHGLINDTIAASGNQTYRFEVRPTIFPHRRRYYIHMRGVTSGGVATVNVPAGGASQSIAFSGLRQDASVPVSVDEDVTSPSTSETELTCKITAPSTTDLVVDSIACVGLPRTSILIGGSELGVDFAGEQPNAPIEADLPDMSLGALVKSVLDTTYGAANSSRRVGLLHWQAAASKVFNTTSFVNTYATGGEPAVLAQQLRSTDASSTTRTIRWRVYAQSTNVVETGSVRATAGHGGATSTISNIGNTLKWYPDTSGAAATLAVDRDDLTSSDGLQSSTFDTIQWAGKVTLGVGTLKVFYASFWTDLV